MRRIFLTLAVALVYGSVVLAAALWGSGKTESAKPTHLVLAIDSDSRRNVGTQIDGPWTFADVLVPAFRKLTGIALDFIPVNSSTGQTERLQAILKAGLPIDAYSDYSGRVGIFDTPEWNALELDSYLTKDDISQYVQSYLDLFTRDGHLYALPMTAWVTVGHANKTLIDKVGMSSVLDDGTLTYDEIEAVAKKARSLLGPDYYATPLFTTTTGGDYWPETFWLSGFGAKLFNAKGNIALNSPEGLKALSTLKRWYDSKLIPEGSAALAVGDYVSAWKSGHYVAWSYSMTPGTMKDFGFEDIHMATPVEKPGMKAPVAVGPDAAMAFKGPNASNAVKLVQFLAGVEYQQWMVDFGGRFPALLSVKKNDSISEWSSATENLKANGILNIGIGLPAYNAIRSEWQKLIQATLNGELTVAEALKRFEENGNAAIAQAAR